MGAKLFGQEFLEDHNFHFVLRMEVYGGEQVRRYLVGLNQIGLILQDELVDEGRECFFSGGLFAFLLRFEVLSIFQESGRVNIFDHLQKLGEIVPFGSNSFLVDIL